MSVPSQSDQGINLELEQNNSSSSSSSSLEDKITRSFALTKEELELWLMRKVELLIRPAMEHLFRSIVKEKLESLQEDIMARIKCNCGKQSGTSESRNLQLKFLDKISLPVFTGKKIKGEGSASIRVALIDGATGEVVKSGPEATANVELAVLEGDSSGNGQDNVTVEDFNNKIIRSRKGKKSLLKGQTDLNLKEGITNIGEISFIHNSSWMKTCELCLGARVVDNFPGITIKATKTESFTLKDSRTTRYGKHYPPALDDKVWRLKNIPRKGAFHDRLKEEKIHTVKDFLKLLVMDPQRLRDIIPPKKWESITDHAKTCIIGEKMYLYYFPNSQRKIGVVFDVVGKVKGLVKESQYVLFDKLTEKEKADAHESVVYAISHLEEAISFNDETSLREGSFRSSESPRLEIPNECNSGPPTTMNTNDYIQPGTLSHGNISSVVWIEESSRMMDRSCFENDDNMDLTGDLFNRSMLSPDSNHLDEFLQSLAIDYNQQPKSPILELPADQTGPGILLFGSQNVSVDDKVQKRWRMVSINLTAIVRMIGCPERIHVQKKQRVT